MSLVFTPGYYAKVRIDDEGKIVDVAQLEKEDLPAHTHSISDIDQTSLENKIAEILSTFFANSGDSAVKFFYDKNTKTVTADVNIDDETIVKNEWGQLSSGIKITSNTTTINNESSNSNSNSNSSDSGNTKKSNTSTNTVISTGISEKDLQDINDSITSLKESIPDTIYNILSQTFTNSRSTAIDFDWDKNTHTISAEVNVDGISISKDENGDLIATGAVVGSGENGNCASHTHLSSQIEDFQEAVVNIFNDYSKNINIDLANLIDGTTIKINEYGQLTAVRTALETHTHYLKDIVDYVAPDPAVKQLMSDLGEDVSLNDGVIDFSKLNIGYSILALSEYLKNVVNKNLSNLSKRIDNINVENDNSGLAYLYVSPESTKNLLTDTKDNTLKEVYLSSTLYLILDFLPYNEGNILLLKGNDIIDVQDISSLNQVNDEVGRFKVIKKYSKKSFIAKVIQINLSNLITQDSYNEFQIKFDLGTNIDFSNQVKLYISPTLEVPYIFTDITPKHRINGKYYYDYPVQYTYQISIPNCKSYRFLNTSAGFKDGKLTGISQNSKTIRLPNLFIDTNIELKFLLEEEHSISNLRNWIKELKNGHIVNDIIVPDNESKNYIVTFEIPNCESFNSLEIYSPDIDIDTLYITKGSLIAKGSTKASLPINSGRIFNPILKENYYLLSFLNNYDSGLDSIRITIDSSKELNLNQLKFFPEII